MTLERSTFEAGEATSARDFDYGIGDDARSSEERIRAEIAARIREAARRDANATLADQVAYERAARIAEGRQP